MPELPQYFMTRALERTATAGEGPRYPAQPTIDEGAATLPARAFGQAGQALGQFGGKVAEAGSAMALIGRRLKEADEEVKRVNALAGILPKLSEEEAAILQNPAIGPLDKADAFGQRMQTHMDVYGKDLPAKQQAAFRLEVTQQTSAMQRTMRKTGFQQWTTDAKAGYDELMAQYTDQETRATDPVQRAALAQSRTALTEQFVAAGIISAEAGTVKLNNTREAVATGKLQAMMRSNPTRLYNELQLHLNGGTTTIPELQDITPTTAIKLNDEASKLWAQDVDRRHNREVVAERAHVKEQEKQEILLRGEIWALEPTPENEPAIAKLRQKSTEMGLAGTIRPEANSQFQSHLTALHEIARKPPIERDDKTVEKDINLRILSARNDADLAKAEAVLIASKDSLTAETFRTLGTSIHSRQTDLTYWKRESYQLGRNRIQNHVIMPGQMLGVPFSQKPEMERKLMLALEAYDFRMQELAKEDVRLMDDQAEEYAQRMIQRYLPFEIKHLPKEVQDAKNEDQLKEVARKLKSDGLPDQQIQQFVDSWRVWAVQPGNPLNPAKPPKPATLTQPKAK